MSDQLPLSKGRDMAEPLPEAMEQVFPSCPHILEQEFLTPGPAEEIALIISLLELFLEVELESLKARPTCL